MTKKDAAVQVFWVAKLIHDELGDDEEAAVWIMLLGAVARDLDPHNDRYNSYFLNDPKPSVLSKLRNLIMHPSTPANEREAAVRAYDRLRRR